MLFLFKEFKTVSFQWNSSTIASFYCLIHLTTKASFLSDHVPLGTFSNPLSILTSSCGYLEYKVLLLLSFDCNFAPFVCSLYLCSNEVQVEPALIIAPLWLVSRNKYTPQLFFIIDSWSFVCTSSTFVEKPLWNNASSFPK